MFLQLFRTAYQTAKSLSIHFIYHHATKNSGTSLACYLVHITFMQYLNKKQEERKTEVDDNNDYAYKTKYVSTMDLSEQQIPGSHSFWPTKLESQVQILFRPQRFMSVFPHFQSVYSPSHLL